MNTPKDAPVAPPAHDLFAAALRAARRGSEDGWRDLHARTHDLLRSLVSRHAGLRLLQRESLDDLVAEVWFRVFRGLPRYEHRSRAGFTAWLRRLVCTTLAARANHHAAAKRAVVPLRLVVAGDGDDGDLVPEACVPSSKSGPQFVAEEHEDRAQLARCTRQLSPDERRFLSLHVAHDGAMHAMGAELGIREAAARMRWVRLRRRVRKLMERRGAA